MFASEHRLDMHGAKLRSSATGSRDAAIRPLPEEVAVRIKSSAIITSLENVVVELFKNALDAGSRRIDITVDFGRGACTVEDDGWGISPAEFLGTGGLGKPFRTLSLCTDCGFADALRRHFEEPSDN